MNFENTNALVKKFLAKPVKVYLTGVLHGETHRAYFELDINILKDFLKFYLTGEKINVEVGLCTNFHDYIVKTKSDLFKPWNREKDAHNFDYVYYSEVMSRLFESTIEEEDVYGGYPFGGEDVYDHETANGTHHKNPLRLAWIKEVLKD